MSQHPNLFSPGSCSVRDNSRTAVQSHLRLYHVITRAGQLSGLDELLNAQMQPDEVQSLYEVRLRSSALKFTQQGGNFSEDLLLGLLLQRGIQDQEMVRTVMLRPENEIANKGRNPNLRIGLPTTQMCPNR
ncbi:hypothetical protein O181_010017 [Austropuccinia psidii MF-1]|uniref:Uncharacterized protein n=1 Tax=Austropuccinia psidii MF-1 TaxID=1389203 RepID=A0A9Q3BRS4_9BASI|nr:hypothetical protein [Austropuccinia psidii MF-1]